MSPPWTRTNWQTYSVRLPDTCNQRTVMQTMLDMGVSTRRGVMNAHRAPAYSSNDWRCGATGTCTCAPNACARLSESERAQDRCIAIPLYPQMTDAEQDHVVHALRIACEKST